MDSAVDTVDVGDGLVLAETHEPDRQSCVVEAVLLIKIAVKLMQEP